jgi:hypothetical protein
MSRLLSLAIALVAAALYGIRYFVKKRNESKDLVRLATLPSLISLSSRLCED